MSAPHTRRVNALTGEVADSGFFKALSEADEFVREIDTVRELQTRVDELTAENRDLRAELAEANRKLSRRGW